MRSAAIFVLLFASAPSFAQNERAVEVRVSAVGASAAAGAAPAALRAGAVPLSASVSAAAPLALAAAAAVVAAPETKLLPGHETALVPAPAGKDAPASARDALFAGAKLSAAPDAKTGRVVFDAESAGKPGAPVVERGASPSGPVLARATERPAAAAPRIPLRQRAAETAELGAYALGFQFLGGLLFLWLGAHAAFPALAGAFWAFAGTELIKALGELRSVIVGGWQASHDQRYRVDPNTGRLRDVRGHKYGQDRYDRRAPGEVSRGERLGLDAAAFALGLPWVLPAGPKAVLLYAAGAAAALAARRLWRAYRPEPAPARPGRAFEYDR